MRKLLTQLLQSLLILTACTSLLNAQVTFGRKTERPASAAQPALESALPDAATPPPSPASLASRGGVVSPNTPLQPGAEVSFSILEENEPPIRAIITDPGALELPYGMGSVMVNGMSPSAAEAAVKRYLESRYYKPGKGSVRIGLNVIPASAQKRAKVIISGKVGRPGASEFYASDPKFLSEVINEAGTTIYSDLENVKVVRGGEEKVYNVRDMLEKGKTANDFKLKDGDRIIVPTKRGLIW